jgi:2-oxoglutarate ferredoxin oxidoreductase subunit alpha
MLVLAPASVQEMADFVALGFDLAFKYRNPVLILSDGLIGQMMEKVELPEFQPRKTEGESWAATGKTSGRERNILTSLRLNAMESERHNTDLQEKYRRMEEEETCCETTLCDDAEYIVVAYGASARVSHKAVELAREQGVKAGLFRPVTLYPFPAKELKMAAKHAKGLLSVEMNAGQMIEDVRLAVDCRIPVQHFGRYGGVVHAPSEILEAIKIFPET